MVGETYQAVGCHDLLTRNMQTSTPTPYEFHSSIINNINMFESRPIKTRKGSKHDKSGCLTCRKRSLVYPDRFMTRELTIDTDERNAQKTLSQYVGTVCG